MSIEETPAIKAPAKKRRPAKKRTAAPPKPKPVAGIYAGMTVMECCASCNADGCVISGKPYCAHPRKGGLHGAELHDSAAMERRRTAEKVLGQQKLVVAE
jgi:hypothetical protein